MPPAPPAPENAAATLCVTCGLCCNGVLFAGTELQTGDDPAKLAALGLALQRKGKKFCFDQPCAALDGKLCRIYPERPVRCRTFECRLLQRVQSGAIKTAAALKTIEVTLRRVEAVRDLARLLGQNQEHLPLSKRCQEIMARPIDLAGGRETIELRHKLMLAVQRMMRVLERHFLA